MPFKKGDPSINRNGRPKNAEPELLREALRKEGEKRGIDFWDKVAEYAFTDKNVMVAVLKKFIADKRFIQYENEVLRTDLFFQNIIAKPVLNERSKANPSNTETESRLD
jgi:hypothetical protein